jgi:hypothetical protein
MAGSVAARAHAPRSALATGHTRTSESSNYGRLLGSTPRSAAIVMIEIPRFSMIVSSYISESLAGPTKANPVVSSSPAVRGCCVLIRWSERKRGACR